ncbi:MAG: polysaccharide biosynthesis/export family protein [Planctomycetota bacterium]|nr:polysaccharide biosynthesis/export family protein [Planctomycetota bacterium]
MKPHSAYLRWMQIATLLVSVCLTGCASSLREVPIVTGEPPVDVGRELDMVSLPRYVIEPPDILLIDAVRIVPKPPFLIESLDVLYLDVSGTLLDAPIRDLYPVDPGGSIDLGANYGKVRVVGMTLDAATVAIERQLRNVLRDPQVSLTLYQSGGKEQIVGPRLVAPDGTINLGVYGSVYVTGMTIPEATHAITTHLSKFLSNPVISVDQLAYNSKFYFVYTEGAGFGDNVVKVPITGKETVLDAITQVQGLSRLSSKKIWIARPSPDPNGCAQILPVSYVDITSNGGPTTNYQVFPGDRIFIEEDHMVAADSSLARIIAPFERIFGFTLLGANTLQTMQRFPAGVQTF